jgi:multiple sugar transport system ATP-binding protein
VATVQFENVSKEFGGGDVVAVRDLSLDVGEGEFLILVGPSGCGKTTALRMVAGLEEITDGRVCIGDRVVNDLPPTERDVAMVFQNYALYPHMTVYDNIAFPLQQHKVRKSEVRERVGGVAELLGIDELLKRRPRELSGGQRQRVAIGRALVRRPQVFLMDEPLSNLDAKLRVQMRAELISLHHRVGITTIYVTHDQTEAMTLGDRVVVMNKGVVQQVDTPERLYRHPTNTFVAGFIGSPAMNFLEGTLVGGGLRLGAHTLELPDTLRSSLARRDGDVIAGVRPEDFAVEGGRGTGAIAAEVRISEHLGPEVLVHFHAAGLRVAKIGERGARTDDEQSGELSDTIVGRFDTDFTSRVGEGVTLSVDTRRLQLFDPDTGESLLSA